MAATEGEDDVLFNALPQTMSVKWRRAMQELVMTERNYVKELNIIMQGYIHVIPDHALSWEEKAVIFCNLDEIFEIHTKFLASLERAVMEEPFLIPTLFLETDFKAAYAQYCSNHPRAVRILQDRLNNPVVKAILQECQGRISQKLPVIEQLIIPVQRIVKYPLLLQEQLKACPPTHPVYEALVNAVDVMRSLASDINRMKRERELQAIIYGEVFVSRTPTLRERLVGFPGDLDLLGSLANEKDGFCMGLDVARAKASASTRYLFLFSNALLSCKERSDGKLAVKDLYLIGSARVSLQDERCFCIEDTQSTSGDAHYYHHPRMDVGPWVLQLHDLARSSRKPHEALETVRRQTMARSQTIMKTLKKASTRAKSTVATDSPAPDATDTAPSQPVDDQSGRVSPRLSRLVMGVRQMQANRQTCYIADAPDVLAMEESAQDNAHSRPSTPAVALVVSEPPQDATPPHPTVVLEPAGAGSGSPGQAAPGTTSPPDRRYLSPADGKGLGVLKDNLTRKLQQDEAQQILLQGRAMHQRAELLQLRSEAERTQLQSLKDALEAKMKAQAEIEQKLHEQQTTADEERRRLEQLHCLLAEHEAKLKEDFENNREAIVKAHQAEVALKEMVREKTAAQARLAAIRTLLMSTEPIVDEASIAADIDLRLFVKAETVPLGDDGIVLDRLTCKGYLVKLGRVHKTWLRRWFVLSLVTKKLTYYTNEDEKTSKGSLDLLEIFNAVQQYTPGDTLSTFHVMTPYRTYHLRSVRSETVRAWLDILRSVVG